MAPSPPPVSPGLVVTPARQEASTPDSGSAGTVIVILVIVLVLLLVLVIAGYFFLRRRNKATKGTIVITRDLDTSTNLGRIIDKEPQLPPPRKQPEPLPSTAAVVLEEEGRLSPSDKIMKQTALALGGGDTLDESVHKTLSEQSPLSKSLSVSDYIMTAAAPTEAVTPSPSKLKVEPTFNEELSSIPFTTAPAAADFIPDDDEKAGRPASPGEQALERALSKHRPATPKVDDPGTPASAWVALQTPSTSGSGKSFSLTPDGNTEKI